MFSNPISNLDVAEPIEVDPGQNEVEIGDVFLQLPRKRRKRSECLLFCLKSKAKPI